MTNEQLKKGVELQELITKTKEALEDLNILIPDDRSEQRIYDDKLYNLTISQYSDGSGIKAVLNRYFGNEKLLKVIKDELEGQLEEFENKFNSL